MKRIALTKEHLEKLTEYNLQTIPKERYYAVRYEAGEMVIQAGITFERLALLVSGMAKICRTAPNGKSLILCYYLSEGIVGELEMLTRQELATTTVTAVSELECILLDYNSCQEELKTNILFLNHLGVMLADKLNKSAENYMMAALCTAEERLCLYILRNSLHGVFTDVLSDVACTIGTSYRHLFRMLARLCTDGVLQKTEHGYILTDVDELVRRSQAAYDHKTKAGVNL